MSDHRELVQIVADASGQIDAASTLTELGAVETDLLGPTSVIAAVRKTMGSLDPSERPKVGAAVHSASREVQGLIDSRRVVLGAIEEERTLRDESIDVTLERVALAAGALHLIQQTIDEIVDIFVGLGYGMVTGPEAELAWYNFDALNTPPTHPARLESDTMYLDYGDPNDELLLRPQTSPMQVRWMEIHEPPVYIVVPGKTYRLDSIDASHLPVFHQIEGLAVQDGITFSDLKGTLSHFAREFFGPTTRVRFRPHFFPFTEPSAELDVSCFACDGGEASCRVCRGAGWLEMLGCGMVDPAVFEAVGYDPQAVTGFAFGMGVERPAMVRHGINDIRHFVDNDIRFLRQF
jgi:phenylalanyl-tRNA synthetase alpha chain